MSKPYKLGLIGGGNMAEAIVRAALDNELVAANHMAMADPVAERRGVFAALGVSVMEDNAGVVSAADHVMLAIKPQTLREIAGDLAAIDETQIVLSIMAGVTTGRIEDAIGKAARVIRIMPNTPLLVGQGMSAIALGRHANMGDEVLAMGIFSSAGEAVLVDEHQLDAVTAVSGSGPAYLFYLAEAMAEAARELGLKGKLAEQLTRQTLRGAAQLLIESDESAAELRRRVTSPGGTTEAAITHLDKSKLKAVVVNAIRKAEQRSRELGK